MIEGLSHITLIASALTQMSAIMSRVLDGQEIYSSGDETFSLAREKFFIVGGQWIAVMEGESLPSRLRIDGEGHSLYFYDHDNHLFELQTGTLDERLEQYRRGLAA